ncbi:MAG: alanine--tRNA ligase [Lachnospiraceae bacterium]|nr:alanine--tRNA ligase [Lachnospiraceae bacterium]
MKKYTVNELRELFLSFFESKGHLRLKSFSLIPENDNSLLIINSGMAPLKPYFKGLEIPPRKRVCTCQKCIRTGDIENIGHTARHGTFFEMLGNFSFGDYFKKEAITWSWEFLTVTLGLDKDRLYPSVYVDDEEAYDLWHDMIGIPSERIFKFGKADNFWEHGSGPCGPCSEIYYDRGEKYGCGKPTCTVGCDCDRYIEVWNNVFTQFDNDGKGNYTELEQKNIDTGMGLERLAVVCQDAESIFEIDTSAELMDNISLITRHIYKDDPKADISLRIIADHIKSCTFMISDGILPSNEGRGYVLRRLLRRAVRHGRILGVKKEFMARLSDVVIKLNGAHYTELYERQDMIKNVLSSEEEKFNQTIDQGLVMLNEVLDKSSGNTLSGDIAFKLYDTYGFPLDLTKEIIEERNVKLDEDRFNELMNEQKKKARAARKISNYMGADATIFNSLPTDMVSTFDGYDKLTTKGKILAIVSDNKILDKIDEGDEAVIISDKTTFYPLMGGQVGDIGKIKIADSEFEVYDTVKILNTKIGHIGKVVSGTFSTGAISDFEVDKENRHLTAINHTSTHLLHAALREVLGKHVEQAGSLVEASRLRFDFTHFKAMTKDELNMVEHIVNQKIAEAIDVTKAEMGLNEAKSKGAMALFGEKYGEVVRTVQVSDFSFELCGGTHIDNTSEIRCFKILSESGIAAGVRRIEAITSDNLLKYYNEELAKIEEISTLLKSNDNDIVNRVEALLKDNRDLKHELDSVKREVAASKVGDITFEDINGLKVCINSFDGKSNIELKDLVDNLKDKNKNYAIVAFSKYEDNIIIVVSLSDTAISKGLHAGNMLKEIAKVLSGNGGGRDKFAEGRGKDYTKIDEAIELSRKLING